MVISNNQNALGCVLSLHLDITLPEKISIDKSYNYPKIFLDLMANRGYVLKKEDQKLFIEKCTHYREDRKLTEKLKDFYFSLKDYSDNNNAYFEYGFENNAFYSKIVNFILDTYLESGVKRSGIYWVDFFNPPQIVIFFNS